MVKLGEVHGVDRTTAARAGVVGGVRGRVIGNTYGPALGSPKITAGTGQFGGIPIVQLGEDKK